MAQAQVTTQRIWGAFAPTTNQIVGVQVSGETPYQSIPNAAIASTYAGVRTLSGSTTETVFAMGHNTITDGAGGTFVYNPADTSSGCVCTGGSAGTVLTVISVQSGTIVNGYTVSSSVTGLPLATITSFGTGVGGVGTYNLSTPVNIGAPFVFLIDNNSTVLVSPDGSRWVLTTTNPIITGITAPSGNSALSITTPLYTFGNATDNPNYLFTGSGVVSLQPALNFATVDPPPQNGMYLQAANTIGISTANTGRMTVNGTGNWTFNAPTSGTNPTITINPTPSGIPGGFLCSASVNGNMVGFQLTNTNAGTAAAAQWSTNTAADTTTYSQYNTGALAVLTGDPGGARTVLYTASTTPVIIGSNAIARLIVTPIGVTGYGTVATAQVDMTPDTFTTTATGVGFGGTAPTWTIRFARYGNIVTGLLVGGVGGGQGTSNATSFTMTFSPVLPASFTPLRQTAATTYWWVDNGAQCECQMSLTGGGMTLFKNGGTSSTTWTAAGVKGTFADGNTPVWSLL
jgi:hypothetical protein